MASKTLFEKEPCIMRCIVDYNEEVSIYLIKRTKVSNLATIDNNNKSTKKKLENNRINRKSSSKLFTSENIQHYESNMIRNEHKI